MSFLCLEIFDWYQEDFLASKTKGTAFAVPSAYGVIIKLSRVETLVNQASTLGIHHNGSGFSSCHRVGGTEVAIRVALHQAGVLPVSYTHLDVYKRQEVYR